MGAVTGKGFAALIRERFGIRWTAFAMLVLLIGNTSTTFSEFAGIASGMELFGVSKYISVPVAAVAVWFLIVGGNYKRVEKVFLAISCVFVTYIIAAVMSGPNWGDTLCHTFLVNVNFEQNYISVIIAMIGTTIAPWMLFFVQSNIVEKGNGAKKSDLKRDLLSGRVDAISGSVAALAVAWFIIVTTGTVLFPQGISVSTAQDAARALAPFAGEYAEILFGVGLVAASFLAACVLPLPPSPIIIQSTGTLISLIISRFLAIASPWPLSSASIPQYAPAVLTKLIIGRPNFSACFINLRAFLYPSGLGIPKFLLRHSLASLPLISVRTVTGCPSSIAIPPIKA